ncbi:MAG TPA: pirin family protein [Candidatus Limiplasma sp.]|nr:pirin family protein [Candidatus Limiplasma sp.]HPS81174.1 pirin family protein [Candidatus Limiplasma sp.]
MARREIVKTVRGRRATDGAGVRLVRVLGYDDTREFDPFLMLDSFDSTNPEDYLPGFPMHPHRGIETVTYLISGRIEHEDSLGNKGVITDGESQWMTAGSGILHQEMPKACPRMLGFQLWLNLPAAEKMCEPAYLGITAADMPEVALDGATLRVISGRYGETVGVTPRHIPATLYDIRLAPGASLTLPTRRGETVFVFLIDGDGLVNGQPTAAKTAVLFGDGDEILLAAKPEAGVRVIFYSGQALHEPIAWGGPIVMNTQLELALAFDELNRGTFIRPR